MEYTARVGGVDPSADRVNCTATAAPQLLFRVAVVATPSGNRRKKAQ